MSCASGCFYCGSVLASRHEHDHWPIPVRHGGEQVVCACINCHDLLDRQPLDKWPDEMWEGAMWSMADYPALARLFFAKVMKIALDMEADRRMSEVAA